MYADKNSRVRNIDFVPDEYHTVKISTDGTDRITLEGSSDEMVKLVVTKKMLAKSAGKLPDVKEE